MLRVICIDDRDDVGFATPENSPEVGKEYTVVGYVYGLGTDGSVDPCYFLAEFSKNYCYLCRWFTPVSEIDETQMERNYDKIFQSLLK